MRENIRKYLLMYPLTVFVFSLSFTMTRAYGSLDLSDDEVCVELPVDVLNESMGQAISMATIIGDEKITVCYKDGCVVNETTGACKDDACVDEKGAEGTPAQKCTFHPADPPVADKRYCDCQNTKPGRDKNPLRTKKRWEELKKKKDADRTGGR